MKNQVENETRQVSEEETDAVLEAGKESPHRQQTRALGTRAKRRLIMEIHVVEPFPGAPQIVWVGPASPHSGTVTTNDPQYNAMVAQLRTGAITIFQQSSSPCEHAS
jgi:hypothetical protein